MSQAHDNREHTAPRPLVIARSFAAPPAMVFQAWSSAEHIRRWFSPATYTTPEAEIDFRPGGVWALCMRAPDGSLSWMRGNFLEIVPPERLVLSTEVHFGGAARFSVLTTVNFAAENAGTRMTVHQEYDIHDANFAGAIAGAPEGWRTTLDKLEAELARMGTVGHQSVVHDAFTLERSYAAAPEAVFHALTDPAAKARWFSGGDGYTVLERSMDVRTGGSERLTGRWTNGRTATFDARYHEVVPNRRLVYAYDMLINGEHFRLTRHGRADRARHRHPPRDHRTGCVPRRILRCRLARARHRLPAGSARGVATGWMRLAQASFHAGSPDRSRLISPAARFPHPGYRKGIACPAARHRP